MGIIYVEYGPEREKTNSALTSYYMHLIIHLSEQNNL